MHIRLANNICDIDFSNPLNLVAVENLIISAVEGKHLLSADISVFRTISQKMVRMSLRAETFLKREIGQFSQTGKIVDIITPKIYVEADIVDPYPDAQRSWHIPLLKFLNIDLVVTSTLLSENQLDCDLYLAAATHYKYKNKLNSLSISRIKTQGGGGSTTGKELKYLIDNQISFCICIVDSDRTHPNGKIGDTANSCLQAYDENAWWIELHITDSREIENEIPLKFIEQCINDNVVRDRLVSIFENHLHLHPEIWSYLDIKKGTTLEWFINLEHGSPAKQFWSILQPSFNMAELCNECQSRNACINKVDDKCQSKIINSVCESIAQQVLDWNNNQNQVKIVENICPAHNKNWLDLGKKVFDFCVGSKVIRS